MVRAGGGSAGVCCARAAEQRTNAIRSPGFVSRCMTSSHGFRHQCCLRGTRPEELRAQRKKKARRRTPGHITEVSLCVYAREVLDVQVLHIQRVLFDEFPA